MPTLPWSKSNRSQASVGSSSEHHSSAAAGMFGGAGTRPPATKRGPHSAEPAAADPHEASAQHQRHQHRFHHPDDQRPQHQQQQQQQQPQVYAQQPSSSLGRAVSQRQSAGIDPPPVNVAASVNAAESQQSAGLDRPADQRYSQYSATSPRSSDAPQPQQEHKRGLRSRLGIGGHSSKDSVDQQPSGTSGKLGRTVSVRKKDGGRDSRYQPQPQPQPAQPEPQQRPPSHQQWPSRSSSAQRLPPSNENDVDPFLVQEDDDNESPPVPAKDTPPHEQGYGQHPLQDQYPRPGLTRVDTNNSYRGQPNQDHFTPEQGAGGHPQAGQYHAYSQQQAQLQQLQHQQFAQQQGLQPNQYQAFPAPPATGPSPGSTPQFAQVQDFGNQPLYSQQQELQLHLQPGRPPAQPIADRQQQPQQQAQPELYQPQAIRGTPQIQQPAQDQQRPSSQQQFVHPSLAQAQPQYHAYDPQSAVSQGSRSPVPSLNPPQGPSQIPVAGQVQGQLAPATGEMPRQHIGGPPSRESSNLSQMPPPQGQMQMQPPTPGMQTFGANVVPQGAQGQPYRTVAQQDSEMGRATPPPTRPANDYSEDDINNMLKDHQTLREKYQKVKRYYFEKEAQVHQLQNTLANQRLSLSRTSLDDTEYSSRFSRLEGLISQLAFSIRKNWKTIPSWLNASVNKEAVSLGKQEMTAVGRAVISAWVSEEVFEKYFHPDLEPILSAQLKTIQINIRRFNPPLGSSEEEEGLSSKVVNWRLATLEGLQDKLRSQESTNNRHALMDSLSERLIDHMRTYLQEPTPSELEGGVKMIVELAVNINCHLPLESREVHIDYFFPGTMVVPELMKIESGIPALTNPTAAAHQPADDSGDAASIVSQDAADGKDSSSADAGPGRASMEQQPQGGNGQGQKDAQSKDAQQRGGRLFGIGANKKPVGSGAQPARQPSVGAGGSQTSLTQQAQGQQGQPQQQGGQQSQAQQGQQPPGSSSGGKDDGMPPRVRLATGLALQVRGKGVLSKSPVYTM